MVEKLSRKEIIQRIRAAEQRAEAFKQQAEVSEQRVKVFERAKVFEQRAEDSEQRVKDLEQRVRKTTLLEHLRNTQDHMYTSLKVQPRTVLTTKGGSTSVTNKVCPVEAAPWPDFIKEQREALGRIIAVLPADARLFESSELTRGYGDRLDRYIGSERDLERFFHTAVKEPVSIILRRVVASAHRLEMAHELNFVRGVHFENHMNVLDADDDDDDVDMTDLIEQAGSGTSGAPTTPPRPTQSDTMQMQLRPDQICVYRTDREDYDGRGERELAFVEMYKSPKQLSKEHIRAVLGPDKARLRMADVINEVKIPSKEQEPVGHFKYAARQLTAMALTQVYHYMLHSGIARGVLTTGEVIVFLKIDWDDNPAVLLYHVAEPGPETRDRPSEDLPYCSAVGQLLAFTLSALIESGPQSQDRRKVAISEANVWAMDWEQIMHRMKKEEVNLRPPPSSGHLYRPATYRELDCTPIKLRLRKNVNYADSSSDASSFRRDESDDHSDDDVGGNAGEGPSSRRKRSPPSPLARRNKSARTSGSQSQQQGQGQRQAPQTDTEKDDIWKKLPYCTHKCLNGLVAGSPLDGDCPNVQLHRAGQEGDSYSKHPISHANFSAQLAEQMRTTLDRGLTALPLIGARGILFRVVLLAHSYVFVGKATRSGLARHLQHEAAVYKRLQPLQGVCVPVCLGVLDLRDVGRRYYYDITTQLVYFVFLSYAGKHVYRNTELDSAPRAKLVSAQAAWARRCIRELGVEHNDESDGNTMWDATGGRVMMIDFERSTLLPVAKGVSENRANTETTESIERTESQVRKRPLGEVSDTQNRKRLRDAVKGEDEEEEKQEGTVMAV